MNDHPKKLGAEDVGSYVMVDWPLCHPSANKLLAVTDDGLYCQVAWGFDIFSKWVPSRCVHRIAPPALISKAVPSFGPWDNPYTEPL